VKATLSSSSTTLPPRTTTSLTLPPLPPSPIPSFLPGKASAAANERIARTLFPGGELPSIAVPILRGCRPDVWEHGDLVEILAVWRELNSVNGAKGGREGGRAGWREEGREGGREGCVGVLVLAKNDNVGVRGFEEGARESGREGGGEGGREGSVMNSPTSPLLFSPFLLGEATAAASLTRPGLASTHCRSCASSMCL